jgi:hypothetical protein
VIQHSPSARNSGCRSHRLPSPWTDTSRCPVQQFPLRIAVLLAPVTAHTSRVPSSFTREYQPLLMRFISESGTTPVDESFASSSHVDTERARKVSLGRGEVVGCGLSCREAPGYPSVPGDCTPRLDRAAADCAVHERAFVRSCRRTTQTSIRTGACVTATTSGVSPPKAQSLLRPVRKPACADERHSERSLTAY